MPADPIMELLEREDIVADRKRREDEIAREHADEQPAATPDVVPAEEPAHEWTREDFLRDLGRASRPAEKPPRETE
jgi:hypothetical protein